MFVPLPPLPPGPPLPRPLPYSPRPPLPSYDDDRSPLSCCNIVSFKVDGFIIAKLLRVLYDGINAVVVHIVADSIAIIVLDSNSICLLDTFIFVLLLYMSIVLFVCQIDG